MLEFSNLPKSKIAEKMDIGISDVLFLYELPVEMLERGNLDTLSLSPNSLFIGCQTWCADMKVGKEFDVLFSHHEVENFVTTKAILMSVKINPSYEIDYLPVGQYGICMINFPEGKPDLLNKLRPENEKNDKNRYDRLYLTQKKMFEKILKELNDENS